MALGESAVESGKWKRLDGIDLLRGLAIFFVLMNHVNIRLLLAKVPYTNGLAPMLVQSLVWNAQFGVQMFFAISGFLITSISLRRWESLSEIRARDFYMLRFARIAPLLFLLLAILSCLHLAGVHNFVVPAKAGGLGRALFAAFTFHLNLLEAWRGYLPGSWDVLWSLSVEEMFYLFFPLLARLLGRRKLFIALLCTFVVLGPFGRRSPTGIRSGRKSLTSEAWMLSPLAVSRLFSSRGFVTDGQRCERSAGLALACLLSSWCSAQNRFYVV